VYNNNILYTSRHIIIIPICYASVAGICGEGTPRGDAPGLRSNRTRVITWSGVSTSDAAADGSAPMSCYDGAIDVAQRTTIPRTNRDARH